MSSHLVVGRMAVWRSNLGLVVVGLGAVLSIAAMHGPFGAPAAQSQPARKQTAILRGVVNRVDGTALASATAYIYTAGPKQGTSPI